ncbi:hypothetical protein XENTR_v10010661 [Xenopus tropicalis]|nr:hypothetical protein XENTR_v10010661 [Xenopus tropicalis]
MTKNIIIRQHSPSTIAITARRIEGACLRVSPSDSLGQHHRRNPVTVTIPVTVRRTEGTCPHSSPILILGSHQGRAVTVMNN